MAEPPQETLRKANKLAMEARIEEDKLSNRLGSGVFPQSSENSSKELAWMLARLETMENEIDRQFEDEKSKSTKYLNCHVLY